MTNKVQKLTPWHIATVILLASAVGSCAQSPNPNPTQEVPASTTQVEVIMPETVRAGERFEVSGVNDTLLRVLEVGVSNSSGSTAYILTAAVLGNEPLSRDHDFMIESVLNADSTSLTFAFPDEAPEDTYTLCITATHDDAPNDVQEVCNKIKVTK